MSKSDTQKPSKASVQSRAWRKANREKYEAGIRKANAARRENPAKWSKKLAQNRLWRKRNVEKLREYDNTRDKVKVNARAVIRNRIWRGTMKRKACEVCLAPNAQAHHDDYKKPLDIKWLCSACHGKEHREAA